MSAVKRVPVLVSEIKVGDRLLPRAFGGDRVVTVKEVWNTRPHDTSGPYRRASFVETDIECEWHASLKVVREGTVS